MGDVCVAGYTESSEELLAEALQTCLTQYNDCTSQRLELVFFSEAVHHSARLSRVFVSVSLQSECFSVVVECFNVKWVECLSVDGWNVSVLWWNDSELIGGMFHCCMVEYFSVNGGIFQACDEMFDCCRGMFQCCG